MNNNELLQRLETCHEWQSKAILELRELANNEERYTAQAIEEIKNKILQNIQYNITEMEIMTSELNGELKSVEKATEEQKEVLIKLGKITK